MALVDQHMETMAAQTPTRAQADTYQPRNPRHPQAVNILLLAAAPLVLWLLRGDGVGILGGALCLGLYWAALWQLSEGLAAEDEYHAAARAAPPDVPRKIIGCILLGVTVGMIAAIKGTTLLSPMIAALMATTLGILTFGIDPIRVKGRKARIRGTANAQSDSDQAAPAVTLELAEQVLSAVMRRVNSLRDQDLTAGIEDFSDETRNILRLIHKDGTAFDRLSPKIGTLLKDVAALVDDFVPGQAERPEPAAKAKFLERLGHIYDAFEMATVGRHSAQHVQPELDVEAMMARVASESAT